MLRNLGIFCISLSLLLGCESGPELTAEEYFEQAKTLYYDDNEPRQAAIAGEKAYDKGYTCAAGLLAEVYNPDARIIKNNDYSWKARTRWPGQDRERSRKWSQSYINMVEEQARQGNADAMLWLSAAYGGSHAPGVQFFQGNDSLSVYWRDRAIDAGHTNALLSYAFEEETEGNREEAIALYKEIALAGNIIGYRMWFSVNFSEDPVGSYEIMGMAIDNKVAGLEDFFVKQVEVLEKQAGNGVEEARTYLNIIDSLDLRTRYEAIKDSVPVMEQEHPLDAFCEPV